VTIRQDKILTITVQIAGGNLPIREDYFEKKTWRKHEMNSFLKAQLKALDEVTLAQLGSL